LPAVRLLLRQRRDRTHGENYASRSSTGCGNRRGPVLGRRRTARPARPTASFSLTS